MSLDNNDFALVMQIEIDKDKISDETGMDKSTLRFSFDRDVYEWSVNVLGVSYDTGYIADSGGFISAGEEIVAQVSWDELYQEGSNKINIYGLCFINGGQFITDEFTLTIDGEEFINTQDKIVDGGDFYVIIISGGDFKNAQEAGIDGGSFSDSQIDVINGGSF